MKRITLEGLTIDHVWEDVRAQAYAAMDAAVTRGARREDLVICTIETNVGAVSIGVGTRTEARAWLMMRGAKEGSRALDALLAPVPDGQTRLIARIPRERRRPEWQTMTVPSDRDGELELVSGRVRSRNERRQR